MPSENILTRAFGAGSFAIGEVVHVVANRTVARAQANIAGNVSGALGVSLGWTVVFAGVQEVLLEPGLIGGLGAGRPLYVSATQPGRATNVPPPLAVPIGTILDSAQYADTGAVTAVIGLGAGRDVQLETSYWGLAHMQQAAAIYARPIADLVPFYEDFTNVARWEQGINTFPANVPTGGIAPQLDEQGGTYEIKSDGQNPGFVSYFLKTFSTLIDPSGVMYLAVRAKWPGPVPMPAGHVAALVSGQSPNQNFDVFITGNPYLGSASHININTYDNNLVDEVSTGFPLDNEWHDYVLYRKDRKIFFSADGAPFQEFVLNYDPETYDPGGKMTATLFAYRTGATPVAFLVDEVLAVGSRAT